MALQLVSILFYLWLSEKCLCLVSRIPIPYGDHLLVFDSQSREEWLKMITLVGFQDIEQWHSDRSLTPHFGHTVSFFKVRKGLTFFPQYSEEFWSIFRSLCLSWKRIFYSFALCSTRWHNVGKGKLHLSPTPHFRFNILPFFANRRYRDQRKRSQKMIPYVTISYLS